MMGYFANGTDGMCYEDKYCFRCAHYGDCAVWDAHFIHNYKECNNEDSILHILIPLGDDCRNGKCKMFIEGNPQQQFEFNED